ncbi:amino acid ABC transporter membrane protein 1 (PAAT family) [Prauserella shujinwangii]|uniref:Amino acid ABC transporter membrane protein 1 (PAAT family) n=1 Tax=Prauserella shujinwangii TaxID=1453103 RepID=A0A2T0LYP9_9PSEU|nr:ectoine/hydroxyectoine ABC transporter permease subunit EhuC [Prauserella shujinwangii]PRX49243.1 amino acid ABC transporter membrane protein 1 (PAAT family) [Prauserella shujinwangii]
MDGPPGLIDWIPNLLRGLGNTMLVTVFGTLLMLVLAVVLGLMARSPRIPVRGVARVVIEFFRGTSLPIQLFWLFYALPMVGFRLEPIVAGVVAFGLNYGAYGAEVVRGAINAVPKPQWEAATALNFSSWQRMTRVIWPQAIPLMIPAMNNLFIQLFKSTPLLFAISIADIMFMGESFRFAGGNSTAMYLLLMAIYFVIAYAVTFLMNLAEAAVKARLGQHEGVRSMFRTRKPVPQEVAP